MKKLFLIPLMALVCSVAAWAGNVSTLEELQAALLAGGEISLTADVDAGTTALTLNKGVTLKGNGHYVKGTNTYVFVVTTDQAVKFDDVVIYAAKTSAGRGIQIKVSNANVTLDNVTINAQERGMDIFDSGVLDNVNVTVNNSIIQNVHSTYGIEYEENGNPVDPTIYDSKTLSISGNYSRGINPGRLTNSSIIINNSVVRGFFYNINVIGGTMEGTEVVASNSSFRGRCAFNIWSKDGGKFTCNDCDVIGINNFDSDQESFACFVLNNDGSTVSSGATLTINGGTYAGVSFNGSGVQNPNARQFLVRARGNNNTVIINNSSYTCPKDLGDSKGGVVEYVDATSKVIVNDGTYNCPELVEGVYSNASSVASIEINGGSYVFNAVSSDMTDGDLYRAVNITAGTFNLDMASLVDPSDESKGLIADGYKQTANANGTYSIVPQTTETQTAAGSDKDDDGVNDVNWNTATDWSTTSQAAEAVPDENTSVTIGNGEDKVSVVVADDGAADVYRVDLADKVTLTVKDNGVLTVGEGGIVAHENAEIVVEDGGTMVLNGKIQGTENIVIEASEGSNTAVLLNPDMNVYGDEHLVATFKFKSKAYHSPTKYVWQRFGIPTFDGNTEILWENSVKTWIYEYGYDVDNWVKLYEGTDGYFSATNKIPFQCYNLTSEAAAPGDVYEFTGALMGNQNAKLDFVKGWNYYANSYTAPISILEFLQDIKEIYGNQISATAYIYRAEDDWWDEISLGTFELAQQLPGIFTVPQTDIDPMQAFVLYLYSGISADGEINYKNHVFDPATGALAGAPRRAKSSGNIDAAIRFSVTDGNVTDVTTLVEGVNFSEAFDNGYDAPKYMNPASFNIYAVGLDNNLGSLATNSLLGSQIAFDAVTTGTYTLTFEGVHATNYALEDLKTGKVVDIIAGNTYVFRAEAGSIGARFRIVEPAKMPTSVESVSEVAKQKGVYTMMGQYLGEKAVLSTLPSGVYVVDGKKVVK